MRSSPPIWFAKRPCPTCRQESALVLVACPRCSRVVGLCDEDGGVVLDPREPRSAAAARVGSDAPCPGCGVGAVRDFDVATDEQLARAGFGAEDYA